MSDAPVSATRGRRAARHADDGDDRPAAPVARPRLVHRRSRAPTSTAARRRRPSSRAACSASSSRCCSASRASARPRCCAPGLVPRLRPRGLLPGVRARRLLAGVAAAGGADQAGDLPRDARPGHWTQPGVGRRGRVAVGVPAPPRRRAAATPTAARCCRC
ncbi:MAG: hypothetical protein MZW92_67500 [Comamonadaceae bacterium]|nr:hypothetical protein [Comamonadaceae bacterium]